MTTAPPGRTRPVWDRLVRSLHWALVVAVAAGWVTTGERFGRWHETVGWAATAIVATRIAWGWLGSGHARWAAFVRSPRATLAYLRRALAGRAPRHVGHNPLGACMVLALFACIFALALTGWLYRSDMFWGSEVLESMHRFFAWTLVVLAALHVGGVAVASRQHRENLVAAMLDGRKRPASGSDIG